MALKGPKAYIVHRCSCNAADSHIEQVVHKGSKHTGPPSAIATALQHLRRPQHCCRHAAEYVAGHAQACEQPISGPVDKGRVAGGMQARLKQLQAAARRPRWHAYTQAHQAGPRAEQAAAQSRLPGAGRPAPFDRGDDSCN